MITAARPGPIGIAVAGGLLISLIFLLSHRTTSSPYFPSIPANSPRTSSALQGIANETLGFEKILVVGLKERTDKRDALTLGASLTGLKFDWIDGVRGEEIPDKAVPFGTDRHKLWENNLGSWRGHMNAVRHILDANMGSALIMEDDMDWDVHIHEQLLQFADGTNHLLAAPEPVSRPAHRLSGSPYGEGWDLLWLGHCGEVFPEDITPPLPYVDPRKYIIAEDPTVPAHAFVRGFQNFSAFPPHTRWVAPTGGPICTFAYALSREGAQKVLYALSVNGLGGPFDNALSDLCRYQPLGMRCLTPTPGYFFHHRAAGLVGADSDIQNAGEGSGEVREKGYTENVVWSTRLNLERLITGQPLQRQFDET